MVEVFVEIKNSSIHEIKIILIIVSHINYMLNMNLPSALIIFYNKYNNYKILKYVYNFKRDGSEC